jgi:hypothetical protein
MGEGVVHRRLQRAHAASDRRRAQRSEDRRRESVAGLTRPPIAGGRSAAKTAGVNGGRRSWRIGATARGVAPPLALHGEAA